MFLTPQQFQAQDRFFEDTLAFRFAASLFANWGVTECEIDSEALENGAFRLTEINPDQYVLDIQNLPEEFYVKSARLGDVDALENGIGLTGGAPAQLQIVVGGTAAGIVGSVKGADGVGVAEAVVALVPQEAARQKQPLFYRSSKTDPPGNFQFTGLIPGEYKVYAWTQVDGEPWFSAEFLRPLESKGKSVTLRDGSSQTVELRVIPAEQ